MYSVWGDCSNPNQKPIYITSRGILGPPKLPSNLVNTITKMIEKAMKDPAFIKIAQDEFLYTVDYLSPEKMKARMQKFEKDFGPKLAEMYK